MTDRIPEKVRPDLQLLERDSDQLLLPYKFYGRDM